MTDSETIRNLVRSTYAARSQGDLNGTMAPFADDAVFELYGQGTGLPNMSNETHGKPALQKILKELIDNFRFSDWQEISFVVEGEKAALHWRAKITYTPNGRSETFDVLDFYEFRDGKLVDFRQSTDTAKIVAMLGSSSEGDDARPRRL